MLSHREAESVGGNHSRHNAKLLNQAKEKERVRVKTAKEGKQSSTELSVEQTTLVAFMQCHSYLRPFCRSNFAWQMFLLVLIEFDLKLERLKICRISQMVSMKTPNRTHQRLVMFFISAPKLWNCEDDMIFLQSIVSIRCFLVISKGVSWLSIPQGKSSVQGKALMSNAQS